MKRRTYMIHLGPELEGGFSVTVPALPGCVTLGEDYDHALAMAQEAIKLGCYISIAGPVTFKNARDLRELVRQLPLEKFLVETDCPYLTPHPHRGKRNEPAYVKLVAQEVARVKGLSLEEVARITSDNAQALFALSPEVQGLRALKF